MFTEQKHLYDKSEWFEGPWQSEPDEIRWIDPLTGFFCLITRHDTMGFLRGYTGVPKGHPAYGDYEGRIYGDWAGEIEGYWCYGFDCAHADDLWNLIPIAGQYQFSKSTDTYRDVEYCYHRIRGIITEIQDDHSS